MKIRNRNKISQTRGEKFVSVLTYLMVVLYALAILLPIYFVVISSFKDNSTIYSAPLSLPTEWNLRNYFGANSRVNLLGAMGNSFYVAIGSEILLLLICFPCAFAISRIKTSLNQFWERIFGVGFLIPAFAIMVPIFFLFFRLKLLLNPWSVILAFTGLRIPFTVLYLSSSMKAIPHELEESAKIDGANWFQIMLRIFLPLSLSSLVTIIIMNFIFAWNEYLISLILLGDSFQTVQRVLPKIVDVYTVPYGVLSAGIVISTIPIYIIFVFFQKRIMSQTLSGAVKG